jgi:hypothetical protein
LRILPLSFSFRETAWRKRCARSAPRDEIDIVITEPDRYRSFAAVRVIDERAVKEIPE